MSVKYILSGIKGNIGSQLKNKLPEYIEYNKNIKPDNKSIFIHLASKSSGNYKSIVKSNIDYLIEVINFCTKNNIQKLVFFSAISIYNKQDVYSITKLLGEQILKESNLKVLILRLPMVLTKESKNGILNRIVSKLETNEDIILFNADKIFNNFISVNDIYKFIKNYKFKKKFEIVDLSTAKDLTLLEITNIMKDYLSSTSCVIQKKSKDSLLRISLDKATIKYNYKPIKTKKILKQWLKEKYKYA